MIVEYDADRGNPWVPHPFSAARFPAIAAAVGLENAREIGRVPSRFLGAIYAAVATVPPKRIVKTRKLMNYDDRVALIREGVRGAGRRWLQLGDDGLRQGLFALALADVLGPGGEILTNDFGNDVVLDTPWWIRRQFPQVQVAARAFNISDGIPYGPFDGVLAANALHSVEDRDPVLREIRFSLAPGGRLVIVEYDTDHGNPLVPHPFSFETWRREGPTVGYTEPRLIGRVAGFFMGGTYAAVAEAPAAAADAVLHSRPHGEDREE